MIDAQKLREILHATAQCIEAKKDELTELDNAIGDGDHGINMARGFIAVDAKLASLSSTDLGALLKGVGMALVSTVGGASGPLYGTAYMQAGKALKGKTEANLTDLETALQAAVAGIQMRGKAQEGDKTMLDALCPAVRALSAAIQAQKHAHEVLDAMAKAALDGAEATKKIIAKKGRASYLGERSLGHQDPGATSMAYILDTLAKLA